MISEKFNQTNEQTSVLMCCAYYTVFTLNLIYSFVIFMFKLLIGSSKHTWVGFSHDKSDLL